MFRRFWCCLGVREVPGREVPLWVPMWIVVWVPGWLEVPVWWFRGFRCLFRDWFRVIQEIVVQVPIVVPMVVSEVLPVWVQLWSSRAAVRVSYHPGPGLIFIHFSSHGCLIYRCCIAHCPSQGKLSQIVPSSWPLGLTSTTWCHMVWWRQRSSEVSRNDARPMHDRKASEAHRSSAQVLSLHLVCARLIFLTFLDSICFTVSIQTWIASTKNWKKKHGRTCSCWLRGDWPRSSLELGTVW
jgi:hypothetical protein